MTFYLIYNNTPCRVGNVILIKPRQNCSHKRVRDGIRCCFHNLFSFLVEKNKEHSQEKLVHSSPSYLRRNIEYFLHVQNKSNSNNSLSTLENKLAMLVPREEKLGFFCSETKQNWNHLLSGCWTNTNIVLTTQTWENIVNTERIIDIDSSLFSIF